MAIGISKEAVERIIKDCNLDYDHYKWLADRLLKECIEIDNMLIAEKIQREVKDDTKLSLSADECKGLFEGHQPTINKVKKFIKETHDK